MCGSMVDIRSAAAEIRRGKKDRRKKETAGQKHNGLPYSMGDSQKRKKLLRKRDSDRYREPKQRFTKPQTGLYTIRAMYSI